MVDDSQNHSLMLIGRGPLCSRRWAVLKAVWCTDTKDSGSQPAFIGARRRVNVICAIRFAVFSVSYSAAHLSASRGALQVSPGSSFFNEPTHLGDRSAIGLFGDVSAKSFVDPNGHGLQLGVTFGSSLRVSSGVLPPP